MFNEAADVLLDPERRAAYDATLDAEKAQEQPVDPGVHRPVEEPAPPPPPAPLFEDSTDDRPAPDVQTDGTARRRGRLSLSRASAEASARRCSPPWAR